MVDALVALAKRAGRRMVVGSALVALGCVISPGISHAQTFPLCAWPIEGTTEGMGNIAFPDNYARYWMTPFDTEEWATMTIAGTYPDARYFSFVVYDGNESQPWVPASVAGHFFDAEIEPDPGSMNPFVTPPNPRRWTSPAGNDSYTIEITREAPLAQGGENTIAVSTKKVWVILRVYVPDNGATLTGGVPLPRVSLTDYGGRTEMLELCSPVNSLQVIISFLNHLFPPGSDLIWQEDQVPPADDRLWFAPPADPPVRLFPNPHNKYIMMMPGPYQPDRIVVIHGKAPSFPGTFDGSAIWEPAPGFRSLQTRYWSACQNDLVRPMPVVGCVADLATEREGGYYTIVSSNDMVRPDWLRPHVTWLPWGDGDAAPGSGDEDQLPKLFVLRNMLPADDFPHSVQAAIERHCGFDFVLPYVPLRSDIDHAGICTREVMGDYYPVAVWCDKSTFIAGGWRACLRAAGAL